MVALSDQRRDLDTAHDLRPDEAGDAVGVDQGIALAGGAGGAADGEEVRAERGEAIDRVSIEAAGQGDEKLLGTSVGDEIRPERPGVKRAGSDPCSRYR